MKNTFKTGSFNIEYIKNEVDMPVSWENHCHSTFEMIGVLEGYVNIMIEGKKYRLNEGQITIIPPLCYHSVKANKTGKYRRVTALFDASAIPSEIRERFIDNTNVAVCFSSHLEALKNICKNPDRIYYSLAQALMIQIIYEDMMAKQKGVFTETDEFLQKAFEYIDLHLHQKILLDDLAQYTSRSKSSFCHLFEKKMNISPKQYILQKKLALASKLIEEGTPHAVAAIKVGYENYSSFYRLYRQKAKI